MIAYSPTLTRSSSRLPVLADSMITAVGHGRSASVARIPRFAQCRPMSISRTRVKADLWLSQITARYRYEAAYARYVGHCPSKPARSPPGSVFGGVNSSTRSVMTIAITASLKASARLVSERVILSSFADEGQSCGRIPKGADCRTSAPRQSVRRRRWANHTREIATVA